MILLLEKNIRGGISSVIGDRYVRSDDNIRILYIDSNNLYGHSMSQTFPYDGKKLMRMLNWKKFQILQMIVILVISLKLI